MEVNHVQLREVIKSCYKARQSLYIWGTIGIGKCLKKDSLVYTPYGNKKIQEMKINDQIFGFNKNGEVGIATVTNKFITTTNGLLEINTDDGNKIECSKEHKFLTDKGWIEAKDLNRDDRILYIGITNENKKDLDKERRKLSSDELWEEKPNSNSNRSTQNFEINNPKEVAIKNKEENKIFKSQNKRGLEETNYRNRNKLFGGINRWRRNYNLPNWRGDSHSSNSINSNYYHTSSTDRMAAQSIERNNNTRFEEIQFGDSNSSHNQRTKNIEIVGEDISLFDNKKETSGNSYEIYQIKKGTSLWNSIFSRRNKIILGDKKIEFKSTTISKIYRKNKTEKTYDISTTFRNYIANGLLVHNSVCVRDTSKELADELNSVYSDTDIEDGKFGFVDVRLSQMDPSDLRGLPKIDDKSTKWITPNWLPKNPDGMGIIFFDELNLAAPSIQASAYQLILDRRLGDYALPEKWVIIAAGNTSEDRANVFDLPGPLKNRFAHVVLRKPSHEDWTEWALNNGIDSRIISFINFSPSALHKYSPDSKENAFPTHRSWGSYCSNLIKGVEEPDKVRILAGISVGEGIANEFDGFLRLANKFNLDEILRDPKKAGEIKEIDQTYCMIGGLVEKYRIKDTHFPKIVECCIYMKPEFAIFMLRCIRAVAGQKKFVTKITELKVWKELSTKYGRYLGY